MGGRCYPDSDANAAQLVRNSAPGTLSLNPEGTFSYTPDYHYVSHDSFTFTWSDGLSPGNSAIVWINVYNNAPQAYDSYVSVSHDRPADIQVSVSDSDNDLLEIVAIDGQEIGLGESVTLASGGAVRVFSQGWLEYTPPAGFVGSDLFSYTVSDGIDADTAYVYIEVTNESPVAVDIEAETIVDTPIAITLIMPHPPSEGETAWAAYDPDGDALTYTILSPPSHGELTECGAYVVYTPEPGYEGMDTFQYQVEDGMGEPAVA
ncbi:MAG: Ig-like domain-containing protein [Gemmatales bacterium]|nr:Ig-like domain-containing protein [Gemmatales bacterium]